jgi:transcriptional regulator GlxA family with amidase domain
MDALEQFQAQLDRQEALLREVLRLVTTKPKPHLSVTEFAKAAGVSSRTIHRHLNERMLCKERGRIPAKFLANYLSQESELRKFVS